MQERSELNKKNYAQKMLLIIFNSNGLEDSVVKRSISYAANQAMNMGMPLDIIMADYGNKREDFVLYQDSLEKIEKNDNKNIGSKVLKMIENDNIKGTKVLHNNTLNNKYDYIEVCGEYNSHYNFYEDNEYLNSYDFEKKEMKQGIEISSLQGEKLEKFSLDINQIISNSLKNHGLLRVQICYAGLNIKLYNDKFNENEVSFYQLLTPEKTVNFTYDVSYPEEFSILLKGGIALDVMLEPDEKFKDTSKVIREMIDNKINAEKKINNTSFNIKEYILNNLVHDYNDQYGNNKFGNKKTGIKSCKLFDPVIEIQNYNKSIKRKDKSIKNAIIFNDKKNKSKKNISTKNVDINHKFYSHHISTGQRDPFKEIYEIRKKEKKKTNTIKNDRLNKKNF